MKQNGLIKIALVTIGVGYFLGMLVLLIAKETKTNK